MSVKAQYQTYRYTDEVAKVHSQSMVECRLSGSEIGSILLVDANATGTECTCVDGEVRYSGKLSLCVVYEDGDKVCRIERGLEFFHKGEDSRISPSCFARTQFVVERISHRREGSGLYLSVIIGATSFVYGSKQMEYLQSGEDLIVQRKNMRLCKTVCVSGETEGEDEFETENVGDVLLCNKRAIVTSCRVRGGQVDVEGEMAIGVCVLKEDNSVVAYERLLPFAVQLTSEEAYGDVTASANVCIKEATLTAGVDEKKSKMLFTYALSCDCKLYIKEDVEVVDDCFSPTAETGVKKQNGVGRYLTKHTKYVEHVSGEGVLSTPIEGTLLVGVMPKATATLKRGENGFEVEGVLTAEVLMKEQGVRSATLSMPFLFPVLADGSEAQVDCMACGLQIKRMKNGGLEVDATIKLALRSYEDEEFSYVESVEEGKAWEKKGSAVSIFLPREGDDLWQVAKRLHCAPEEVQKSNPDLQFPIKEGERLFIYRQIK